MIIKTLLSNYLIIGLCTTANAQTTVDKELKIKPYEGLSSPQGDLGDFAENFRKPILLLGT